MRRSVAVVVGAVLASGTLILGGAAASAAKAGRCGSAPFDGTISRTEGGSQPAAEVADTDIASATVFDYGTRTNYKIFLAEHRLDPDTLGGQVEAPPGEVLVTIFLRAKNGKDLEAGQKLRPGRDPITVVVDAGGGALAVTGDATGTVTIKKLSSKLVCFAIDYEDEYQVVNGTVRARIPS